MRDDDGHVTGPPVMQVLAPAHVNLWERDSSVTEELRRARAAHASNPSASALSLLMLAHACFTSHPPSLPPWPASQLKKHLQTLTQPQLSSSIPRHGRPNHVLLQPHLPLRPSRLAVPARNPDAARVQACATRPIRQRPRVVHAHLSRRARCRPGALPLSPTTRIRFGFIPSPQDPDSFGAVPVLRDGDFLMAESAPIARYVFAKSGMRPSPQEDARTTIFMEQVAGNIIGPW